jgi:hypothetical protein
VSESRKEAKERLARATHAIHAAVMLVKMERPTIEALLEECRVMDSAGPILNPTLFNNSERRAVSSFLEPIFRDALGFLSKYEAQAAVALAALGKVKAS